MPTIKKQIEEATDAELREFATGTLQIELSEKVKTRAQLLAAIGPAWAHQFVLVEEPEGSPVVEGQTVEVRKPTTKLKAGGRYKDDPVVVVEIQSTTLPGGGDPVCVNVNGDQVVIQREMRVEMPYRFYLALKEAHEVAVTQDPKTLQFNYRRTTNFPMTVEQMPSRAEIEAWHERTKDKVLG